MDFFISTNQYSITYKDETGDEINISDDDDLQTAYDEGAVQRQLKLILAPRPGETEDVENQVEAKPRKEKEPTKTLKKEETEPVADVSKDISDFKFEKVGRKTWQEAQEYAEEEEAHLPTHDEIRWILSQKSKDEVPFANGDIWVPTGTSDTKDWVQVGTNSYHNAGKSHVKAYGYPRWGDSKPESADSQQYMMWVSNERPSRFEISKVERDEIIRSTITKIDNNKDGKPINIAETNSIGNIKGISLNKWLIPYMTKEFEKMRPPSQPPIPAGSSDVVDFKIKCNGCGENIINIRY